MAVDTITLEDVKAAAARIRPHVHRTPLLHSATLSELSGADLRLKAENLQKTGSFKPRGGINATLQLAPEERSRGVISISAGNHAAALAFAARMAGTHATLVMPETASLSKIAATRGYGAEVVLVDGRRLMESMEEIQREQGQTFIHPFDHPQVIAGQGTVGLEMLEAIPALDVIVVPVGGGGLIAGIASAARALNPKIRIYGVESRTYPSMHQRLAGEPVKVGGDTIAEGIAVKDVGDTAFDIVKQQVEDVVVVAEETIERAVVALIEIEKTVAEGAGAAALAALLEHPQRFAGKRVGLPISGGNIDSRVLASVLMRGLVRDARLVRLQVTMPDVSGSLAKVAQLIADAGGNIVEVQHQRIFCTASVRSPEVEFLVETRDSEHTRALVRSLEEKGIRVSVS